MTDQQRHELYLLLMGPAHKNLEDVHELAEFAVEEMEILEPFIDEMLAAAFSMGKMEAYLELWARQEERLQEYSS